MIASIRKALVPVGVALALKALSYLGIIATPELATQVTLVVSSLLVYLIPNN